VHADHHHAVLGVENVELARPSLDERRRRLHRSARQYDRVLKERRTVEHPAKRQLDDLRLAAFDYVEIGLSSSKKFEE
jgi:hypothetical protein